MMIRGHSISVARVTRWFTAAQMSRTLRRVLVIWLVVSMTLLTIYSVTKQLVWTFGYYYVLLVGVGLPMWHWRARIRNLLHDWRAPQWLRFLALGYGMVLLEEVFAALFNHLNEGFSPLLYLARIGQFWALNVFAFTGLLFATWLAYTRVRYTPWEMFCLTGITGLYSEHVIFDLPAKPVEFFVAAPVVFFVCGIILAPAIMSVTTQPQRTWWAPVRWVGFLAAWYLFVQPPMIVLFLLRHRFPVLFPPCNLIPC